MNIHIWRKSDRFEAHELGISRPDGRERQEPSRARVAGNVGENPTVLGSTPSVSAIAVPPGAALDMAPLRPEFLLSYLDLAIRGALGYSANQGVYLSPWWELPAPARANVRGWKRAVLCRNPHGGADHWGHLFLLCHEGVGRAELESEKLALVGGRERRQLIEIPLRVGQPEVILVLRPTYEETREELHRFARDIVDRFRLQLD